MYSVPLQHFRRTFSRSCVLSKALTNVNKDAGTQTQTLKNPVKYKLTYFDMKCLAEPIRWQFILAGVEFEDCRISSADWDKQYKQRWGQIPVLNFDGQELSQSRAIARYLAKTFNQMAETDVQNARCDEIVDGVCDIRTLWRAWLGAKTEDDKKDHEKNLLENVFPHYFSKINDVVEACGGKKGFAVGEKITWADLFLANYLEIWGDNHGLQILDKFSALRKQKETVFNVPQIKEWAKKRPKTAI